MEFSHPSSQFLARLAALDHFVREMELGHLVYDNGRLWSLWEQRRGWLPEPKPADKLMRNGYLMVRSLVGGMRFFAMSHRVIYCYFHKCRLLPGIEINHLNLKRDDNRIENLEPIDRVGNIRHAVDNGHSPGVLGDKNVRCKVPQADIPLIKELRALGVRADFLAQKYGIRTNHIYRITSGERRAK